MGRIDKSLLWCPFPDCFSCPHPDCIKERIFEPMPKDAPRQAPEKKMSFIKPEQVERNRQMAREYYRRNRDAINAAKREQRARNREVQGAKEYLSGGQIGQRTDKGTGR